MPLNLALDELLEYTDWQRERWQAWLQKQGDAVLKTSVGPNGGGRFTTIGDWIRHMFSAETRYIERLSGQPLSDATSVPSENIESLFAFGRQSRKMLRDFVETYPAQEWDVMKEFDFFGNTLKATPRKIIVHVVMHEIRHWAQIATLFRLNGLPNDFQDFLFSSALGGEFRRKPQTA